MPQTFEPINLPFSTSDAEQPSLAFEQGQIKVRFVDWKEQEVQLLFRDMIAFCWDEGDADCSEGHRDDLCYTVVESEWLKRHIAVGVISKLENYASMWRAFDKYFLRIWRSWSEQTFIFKKTFSSSRKPSIGQIIRAPCFNHSQRSPTRWNQAIQCPRLACTSKRRSRVFTMKHGFRPTLWLVASGLGSGGTTRQNIMNWLPVKSFSMNSQMDLWSVVRIGWN
jgi:hypothetical protein